MTKRRIMLFEECSEAYVIKRMRDFAFDPPIGLKVRDGHSIEVGTALDLPATVQGKAVASRHHVAWFWKTEVLVASEGPDGTFYEWFPAKQVKFT